MILILMTLPFDLSLLYPVLRLAARAGVPERRLTMENPTTGRTVLGWRSKRSPPRLFYYDHNEGKWWFYSRDGKEWREGDPPLAWLDTEVAFQHAVDIGQGE